MRKNILITGRPQSGKSTFLEQLTASYPNKIGFVTREMRADDVRTGFELVSFDGRKVKLADTEAMSLYKVGKYYVQVENIDPFLAYISLPPDNKENLLYIDEIGQMQLFSENSKKMVLEFLNSTNTCVATITSVYEDDFTKAVKARNDVIIIEITPENRVARLEFARTLLKKIEKAKRYVSEPERFSFKDNTEVTVRSDHNLRKLVYTNNAWHCECDFFRSHAICSHVIALEEIQNRRD